MIQIAICDDDKDMGTRLEEKVNFYFKKNNISVQITKYVQSRNLKGDIEEGKFFDLILTDIEMPNIDGMKLTSDIKNYLPEVLIIFITSHIKYAPEAFELSVFRYIPKGVIEIKLPQALDDAVNMIGIQAEECYTIALLNRVEKIPYRKILYIHREGKNAIFILTDKRETKIRKSLLQVMDELNPREFEYIDRGNIVNLTHVIGIKKDMLELKNGINLQMSHAKIGQIKEKLNDFWGGMV